MRDLIFFLIFRKILSKLVQLNSYLKNFSVIQLIYLCGAGKYNISVLFFQREYHIFPFLYIIIVIICASRDDRTSNVGQSISHVAIF